METQAAARCEHRASRRATATRQAEGAAEGERDIPCILDSEIGVPRRDKRRKTSRKKCGTTAAAKGPLYSAPESKFRSADCFFFYDISSDSTGLSERKINCLTPVCLPFAPLHGRAQALA